MATTIGRFAWTDDSGTPASPVGDGTTINNAQLQAIFDEVDAVLAAAVTIGGVISSEAFGAHTFSAGGTGVNRIIIRNTTPGTGNYAALDLGNDASANALRIYATATTFTPSAWVLADAGHIEIGRVGGLSYATTHASATQRWYTNSTERLRLNAAGILGVVRGGAAFDGTFSTAMELNGPASNFGQLITLIRAGTAAYSMGFAYNTSTLAIGIGQTTDSNFTAAVAALTITVNKEVQAPSQPGFLAYNSVSDTSVANGSTVDFDTEVYDEGADFSADTFTAPVAGRYWLSCGIGFDNDSGGATTVGAKIVVSNHASGFYIGSKEVEIGERVAFSGAVLVDMDASDTATVVTATGASVSVLGDASVRWTWFSGRLAV